ncbi:MAG: glycosyl hydrolase family 17 protein [Flavobacteriaceae bacterium]
MRYLLALISVMIIVACQQKVQPIQNQRINAAEILSNPAYKGISYGGYRFNSREIQPTVDEIIKDLKILNALDYKLIRTYNVHFEFAHNVLKAIEILKKQSPEFEMYVMLGAWINCKNAWSDQPDHDNEDFDSNEKEIIRVVELAQTYPDIVKIISVGNEARVRWQTNYYVQPKVILNWVNHLQQLKKDKKLPENLWITSSDDFTSWGGGDPSYHHPDLEKLVNAVDYISMHTYPFHNTHYNPEFWISNNHNKDQLTDKQLIDSAMVRAVKFATFQYNSVKKYIKSIDVNKPVHIGETGWASQSSGFYGSKGSRAADEFKQAAYYKLISNWAEQNMINCIFFAAFDEPWKNPLDPQHSENHFGLITSDGKAKYAIWKFLDNHKLTGLSRGKNPLIKTFKGDENELLSSILTPVEK